MIELPVGTKFISDGIMYEVVKTDDVADCHACDVCADDCELLLCLLQERSDNTEVVFRRVNNG